MTVVAASGKRFVTDLGSWRRSAGALLLAVFCASAADRLGDSPPDALQFVDVTKSSGIADFVGLQGSPAKDHIIEVMGGGAAFLDYNSDGNVDILLVRGSTIEDYQQKGGHPVAALYRGDGGGNFQDVSEPAGVTARGWGQGVAAADYDNDGHLDIFITGYGRNFLFHNKGDGTFKEVAASAGVAETEWALGAAFADIDRDGDLDLYVSNYLSYPLERLPKRDANCNYRGFAVFCGPRGLPGLRDSLYLNDGEGRFTDVAEGRGIDPEKLYGLGVLIADWNNDGWPDIFVANDLTGNLYYENQGDGSFEDLGVVLGVAFSEDGIEEGSMGVDFADINQDGWLDLYYTNSSFESNSLLVNNQDGSFTSLTNAAGHGQSTYLHVGWGVSFGDLDNDGLEDLFIVNGHLYPEADQFEMGLKYKQRWLAYMNRDGRQFEERGQNFGLNRVEASRGLALGDYDNDGDLDAVINNLDGPPTLLRNDGGNRSNWLQLQLECTASNRSAVGARVIARSGDRQWIREVRSGASYLSHNPLRVHIGLGGADKLEELEIRWPSGSVERRQAVEVNRITAIKEKKVE